MAVTEDGVLLSGEAHEGHRQRLKNRAWEMGLLSLPPHEVMELLLYYAVPRRDMNETAHRLIDTFGSIRGVFKASYEQLVKVEGVGDKAAKMLGAFARAVNAYRNLPGDIAPVIKTRKDAIGYASRLFMFDRRAQTWIALVNSGGVVSYEARLQTGAMWYNERIRKFIAGRALQHDAHEVIIISRRGMDMPSPLFSDKQALMDLALSLKAIDVYIMDYIIVGPKKNVSMRQVLNIGLTRYEQPDSADSIREDWGKEEDGVEEASEFSLEE